MISALMEAALRALAMAIMVWAGLRLLRVKQVPVEKAAWALVLVAALATPFWIRWQALSLPIAVRVPQFLVPQSLVPAQFASWPVQKTAPLVPERTSFESVRPAAKGYKFPAPNLPKPSPFSIQPDTQAHPRHAPGSSRPEPALQAPPKTRKAWLTLPVLAAVLYLAVTALLFVRTFVGLAGAIRLYYASKPVFLHYPPFSPAGPADGLRIRSSSAIASPVTIGSGVVLPADYVHWDWEKLRIVLAHERAHVDQGDFYLQLLTRFYTALFWFSPLGWWLERKLSDLGETISDRAGIEQAGSHTGYAQILLEFAARPRPTVLGVAMARTANLSTRIERLLNESHFRQAFSGTGRRRWLALLLVLAAMLGGKAVVRVKAAGQEAPVAPATPRGAPEPAPAAPPAPAVAPVEPAAVSASATATEAAPGAVLNAAPVPAAPAYGEIHDAADERTVALSKGQDSATLTANTMKAEYPGSAEGQSDSYHSYSDSNRESWALVRGSSQNVTFSGDWHNSTRDSIDKARKLAANGNFLWFLHDGKPYFVEDAATLSRIDAMYKPIEELGRRQEELGKKQEELGRQQEVFGRQQEQATVPTPDMTKEMADLNAAMAKIQAKMGKNVSQDELSELQEKLGDLQGKLGSLEGQIGEQQGKLGEQQGKLGEQQGKLGEEQGRLGEQQGRLSEEAEPKIKEMIDESLRSGKARPVE